MRRKRSLLALQARETAAIDLEYTKGAEPIDIGPAPFHFLDFLWIRSATLVTSPADRRRSHLPRGCLSLLPSLLKFRDPPGK